MQINNTNYKMLEINPEGFFLHYEETLDETTLADFVVHEMCYQSLPCCHEVELIFKDGSVYTSIYINGRQIAHLHILFRRSMPEHFIRYSNDYQQHLLKPIKLPFKKPFVRPKIDLQQLAK